MTPSDVEAFVKRHALDLPTDTILTMFTDAKGAYTPNGCLTLHDIQHACSFRKRRVVVRAPHRPATLHIAEYVCCQPRRSPGVEQRSAVRRARAPCAC